MPQPPNPTTQDGISRGGSQPHPSAPRSCGVCRICCKLPSIPELDKPADTWCEHAALTNAKPGCSIYDDRPGVCRDFKCAWLDGLGEERDRPDRLGVMWQPITMPTGEPGLAFVEARPGALQTPRVRALLREFMRKKPGQIIQRRSGRASFEPVPMTLDRNALRVKAGSLIEPKPSAKPEPTPPSSAEPGAVLPPRSPGSVLGAAGRVQ